MDEPYQLPRDTRFGLLGAVMLATLLVAAAFAWWLTQTRGQTSIRGRQIIETIRQKGLGAVWGDQRVEAFYLMRTTSGRPVGWRYVMRQPVGADGKFAGGYEGLELIVPYDGDRLIALDREFWRLAADAAAGQYEAYAGQILDTTIDLAAGKVAVNRRHVSPAPANYVPEGATSAAMSLALAGDQPAVVQIIVNSRALRGSAVRFSAMRLAPQPGSRLKAELEGGSMQLYSFGDDGLPDIIEDVGNNVTSMRVSDKEVTNAYPQARRLVAEAIEKMQYVEGPADL